jgi:hypothetical protein
MGRDDSPPMSRMSAPSATIRSARATAAATMSPPSASRPSHENESGVTLMTPMTYVRSPQAKRRRPIRSGSGTPGTPDGAPGGGAKEGVVAPPPESGRLTTTPRSVGS